MPEYIDVNMMNFGELQSEVLRLLWIGFTEESDGSPPLSAFTKRFSQYRVQKKINEAYAQIAGMSKCISNWFIVTLKTSYNEYPVPLSIIDISKVYYFSGATDYEELPIRTRDLLEDLVPGWMTTPGTPQYVYPGEWRRTARSIGVAPAPDADGTAPTLGSGLYKKYGAYGAVEGVGGSAGVASATSTYVDSEGQNFSELGVIVGNVVLNVSDGSRGTITGITTTATDYDTIACSGSLSGGAANVWTAGDEMKIIGGEYNPIITVDQSEVEYLLAANVGKMWQAGLTMAAGNLLINCVTLPLLLRENRQYPELHPLFHGAIALGAAARLGLQEPASSPEYAQAKEYELKFMSDVGTASATIKTQYSGGNIQIISDSSRSRRRR